MYGSVEGDDGGWGGRAGKGSGASYQRGPVDQAGGHAMQQLAREQQEFRDLVNAMAKVQKSGFRSEGEKRTMAASRERAKDLARSIRSQLAISQRGEERRVQQKLEREFMDDFVRFSRVVKEVLELEKQVVQDARHRTPQPRQEAEPVQVMSVVQGQAYTDALLLEEKNKEIRALEQDLVEVQELMRDVNTLVHSQQEGIDSIEANIESTLVQVEKGNEKLVKAGKSQKSSRKKMCCLITLILIIAIVLVVVFGVLKR